MSNKNKFLRPKLVNSTPRTLGICPAARSSAARHGAKAPAAAARTEAAVQTEAAVWVIDLRFLTAHCCASVGIRRVLTFAGGA